MNTSTWHILCSGPVMVDFMSTWLGATGYPDQALLLGVSVIFQMRLTCETVSSVGCPPQCGRVFAIHWGPGNKSKGREILSACMLSWDVSLLPHMAWGLQHWLSWSSGLWAWTRLTLLASLALQLAGGRSGDSAASISVWVNESPHTSLLVLFPWRTMTNTGRLCITN